MSETVPHGRAAGAEEPGDRAQAIESPRRRRRWMIVGPLVIVVAGGLAAAWSAGAFRPDNASNGNTGAPPPATWAVAQENITQTTQENATLGYAGAYTVTGKTSAAADALEKHLGAPDPTGSLPPGLGGDRSRRF